MPDMPCEFSRPFEVDRLGDEAVELEISANDGERAALAVRLDLAALPALKAVLKVRGVPGRRPLVRVTGTLSAVVEQTCVVTLEPLTRSIEASVERLFGELEEEAVPEELDIDFLTDDPPDPIESGVMDLGEMVAETLALEIDPFPRKEGVIFEGYGEPETGEAAASSGPFAKLAALKNGRNR